MLISDIQRNSHDDQNVLTIIGGSIAGLFLVASAFLCVTACIVKHCIHHRRSRILAGVDLQVAESIYDTIDPSYAVIGQARKETKITVNDAYNLEF